MYSYSRSSKTPIVPPWNNKQDRRTFNYRPETKAYGRNFFFFNYVHGQMNIHIYFKYLPHWDSINRPIFKELFSLSKYFPYWDNVYRFTFICVGITVFIITMSLYLLCSNAIKYFLLNCNAEPSWRSVPDTEVATLGEDRINKFNHCLNNII